MTKVGWNPHNITMEKQLHGRRLILKGEPVRDSFPWVYVLSNSVQGADKWSANIFVTPKH